MKNEQEMLELRHGTNEPMKLTIFQAKKLF
jgi:hypothetical protein